MLTKVEFLGLGAKLPDNKIQIGGPTGPLPLPADPSVALGVFALHGWDPGDSEDERVGHDLAAKMAAVGNAGADGKYTASEIAELLATYDPKFAAKTHLPEIVGAGQQVFDALENDGRVDLAEGVGIVGTVANLLGIHGVQDITGIVGKVKNLFGR